MYCQHAHKLRLNMGTGVADVVSERPRHKRTGAWLDGLAGTQVTVPIGVIGFDVAAALRSGALAELPCRDHPGEPAADDGHSARNAAGGEEGEDG